jgi:ABC-type molybdenum transport system ATPase subunit/photorepair protein PhrA
MSTSKLSLMRFRSPQQRFARSINVERDAGSAAIDGYLPVGRALDTVHRIAGSLLDHSVERAFSVTGPYGSGKSSLAVLLDALFAPASDEAFGIATDLVAAVAPDTSDLLQRARAATGAAKSGFLRCLVTAEREPVAATVVRALLNGLETYRHSHRSREATELIALLKDLAGDPREPRTRPIDPVAVRHALARASKLAPILLVIDEFGKNLEAFADARGDADLFLLQQLAEWSRGETGIPVVVVTLQHMAFGEYAEGASVAHRREWTKIQGRFEDIPFTDSAAQIRSLIGAAFDHHGHQSFDRACAEWAAQEASHAQKLGLNDVADPALLEACWPLHPLTLLVLPDLCQRYGQNERTLFSFLAGTQANGVRAWLEDHDWSQGTELPSIGLNAVYEYFVDSAANLAGVSTAASRWLEVETRIRDAHGLNSGQRRVVRAVGLLNLVASGGSLRASRALVRWAANDGDVGTQSEDAVRRRLNELERAGLLTFRDFADEYRVWQGSDFDLRGAIDAARSRVLSESLANVLERVRPLGPIIAGRHSHESGTLRSFARHWADGDTRISAHDTSAAVDGSVYFVLDDRDPSQIVTEEGAKPVVLVTSGQVDVVREAAIECASLHEALRSGDQISDWVAERELRERLDESITKFDLAFDATFGSRAADVVWQTARPDKGPQLIPAVSASSALSWVCDRVYDQAPRVRNDLINRRELTSQAAKARRMLMEAMLRPDRPKLGIEGFGPERAMYEALLASTGMHYEDRGGWRLRRPTATSGCQPVWDHIVARFYAATGERADVSEIFETLARPPYGLREGFAPVMLVAALQVNGEQVALYEHGTFRPVITADILERLVRNPGHFEIKYFGSRSGGRARFLEVLRDALPPAPAHSLRSDGVLAVVAQLMHVLNTAPQYARQTRHMSAQAQAVRRALLSATEPDELLFTDLPLAVGASPVSIVTRQTSAMLQETASALATAAEEIANSYPAMLEGVRDKLAENSAAPRQRLMANLRERAAMLEGKVLDPRLRSFTKAMATDFGEDLDGWTELVAMNVTQVTPTTWTDDDHERFLANLAELTGTFRRLEAINYDRLAETGESADAVRVTLTRPDGYESAQLVWIDAAARAAVDHHGGTAVEALASILGSRARARESLIAWAAGLDRANHELIGEQSTPPASKLVKRRSNP